MFQEMAFYLIRLKNGVKNRNGYNIFKKMALLKADLF